MLKARFVNIIALSLVFVVLLLSIRSILWPNWQNLSHRPRLVNEIQEIVIGLSRDEIIDLLGIPQPHNHGFGSYAHDRRVIVYPIDNRNGKFLVISLNDECIATHVQTSRN